MLDKLIIGVAGGITGGILGTVDGFAKGVGIWPNNYQNTGGFENNNKTSPGNYGNGNGGAVKASENSGGRRQKDRE
ncbi:unnamed protein product [Arabidopsis thaliana]|uniref:Uncharacterized protein n=3 Tax=Arabidopsis TaxID=3701 RepID=A0A8T2HFP6_ARASU|nr:hypothetical protein ISN45_At01g058420 [Arabidopsis thaliana x Arabidopsis arenosa]KAG7658788.1 hypothetical protein ISN44_As01g057440 [Arabidopsis suecica]OAP18592.1 hypothetical protein AXX17_AT1G61880 [Arabidopsis thaliana]CAA0322512.1 unnamed protein product [Arabidopsis thaliana]CAD5316592.1 unnamed protein product [Arabidopsis thaliana]